MNLKNLSIPELQALILAAQNELKRRLATAKQNNAGNFGKVLQTWGDDPSTYASTANQTVQQLTTLSSEMNGLNGDLSAAKAEEAKEKTNGNFQAAKKAQTEVRRLKGELDKKKADREELGKSRITDVEHAIHAILIQQAELEQKIKRALDKGDYDAADQHQKNKIHLKDAMAKIKKIHAHLVNVLQKAKKAGYSAKQAKNAGYTAKQAKEAGYSVAELLQAAFHLPKVPHVTVTGCSSQHGSGRCKPENTLHDDSKDDRYWWRSASNKDHDQWIDYSFNGQRYAITQVRINGGDRSYGVRTVQVREIPSLKVLHTFVTKEGYQYETHTVEGVNADKIRLHFVDSHGNRGAMTVRHVEFLGF